MSIDWRFPTGVLGRLALPAIGRLVAALLPRDARAERTALVAAGVARKINLMPVYLAFPVLGATLVLDLWLRGLGFRNSRAAADKARELASARASYAGFRDIALLYERLAAFVYYSLPEQAGDAGGAKSAPDHTATPKSFSCDVLVIGSGPGGGVTAAILARAGYDVLLIEEGPDTRDLALLPYSSQEMDKKYRNGGLTPCLGAARLTYAEARCLGGGSEINSGLFHRIPENVLAEWRRSNGLHDLTAGTLEPYYETVVDRLSIGSLRMGEGAASLALKRGADALGWASEEVPRWISSHQDELGRWVSKRTGISASFIADAENAGCRVQCSTAIDKLALDGPRAGRAAGRIMNGYGTAEDISIRFKWAFVCAGPIGTPALLRRSGIKRNVGNTLQLHPMLRAVARFDEDVNEGDFGVPVRQVVHFKPQLTLGCSMSSLPHLALWMAGRPADFDIRTELKRMAVFYALTRSSTLGRVRNIRPFTEPLVSWTLAPEDYRLLGDGLARLCELLFMAGAKKVFLPMRDPAPVSGMKEVEQAVARFTSLQPEVTAIHLFASCPLGDDADRFPLDPYGRVHGTDNLFVNDASMLPGTTGVNPQGTIMALALRNIASFLASTKAGN